MVDLDKSHLLGEKSYFKEEHKKTQIVIGNTLNTGLTHFDIWRDKLNGNYKGTSPYTIGLNGVIYEHYNPKYYSTFIKDDNMDKKIICLIINISQFSAITGESVSYNK